MAVDANTVRRVARLARIHEPDSRLESLAGELNTILGWIEMLNEVDDDGSGGIEFPEFLKVIDSQKAKLASDHDESDMIDAFVAMGGGADRSGNVEAEKLRRTIKAFELTIDIERLIKEVSRALDISAAVDLMSI